MFSRPLNVWPISYSLLIGIFVGLTIGFSLWRPSKTSDQYKGFVDNWKKEYQNECSCEMTQTCPFGPGIVGEQKCLTSTNYANRWSRCEPKQK
jgi:hypothetical protein